MTTYIQFRNTKWSILGLVLITIILSGCASGKRRFQKGDFDAATYQAINRLRNNPDNKKARNYLPLAYKHALDFHLNQINQLKQSPDEFKFDAIVSHYTILNDMHLQINLCPGCMNVVPNPSLFTQELNAASLDASKAHFNAGLRDMELKTKQGARNAYHHFVRAKNFAPSFNKIDEYLENALNLGTVNVLMSDIPVHSRSLDLTNQFFQNQLLEAARSFNFTFVRFFRQQELNDLQLEPDEVVLMRFDDFVVGQTLVREREVEVTRDSVKIGTIDTDEGKKDIYGTAKATLFTYEKTITSSGLLDFQIVEAINGATLLQRKLPGTYVWRADWASYQGMEEALSDEQLDQARRREVFPPSPQDLFVSFTQPIYNQVINEVRRRYRQIN